MERRAHWVVIRNALIVFAWVGALAVVAQPVRAEAKPIVLNCNIEESGYKDTQITIDEDAGTVIYNSHLTGPDPIVEFQSEDGTKTKIDVSMKITINTEKFIMANDQSGAFVLTKHDVRFAHAWVLPFKGPDGSYFAFANNLSGTCVKSPFD